MNFSIDHDKPRKFMKVFVSSHICGSHICTHTAVSVPKNHVISLKIAFFAFFGNLYVVYGWFKAV